MTNPIRTSWWTEGPQWLLLLGMFGLAGWLPGTRASCANAVRRLAMPLNSRLRCWV